jgi:hypothetical protein
MSEGHQAGLSFLERLGRFSAKGWGSTISFYPLNHPGSRSDLPALGHFKDPQAWPHSILTQGSGAGLGLGGLGQGRLCAQEKHWVWCSEV